MSRTFAVRLEQGYTRRSLFAAEITDAVTLAPVTTDINVSATGLRNGPILNWGGSYVWLEEDGGQPQSVVIDATGTQYESVSVPAPVPPARSVRVELSPRYGYAFPPGVTAMRGSLIESLFGTPRPVVDGEVWLQWIDDNAPGTRWIDAPTHSHSGTNGEFAVLLRFSPTQVPKADAGGAVIARLSVRREGVLRSSTQFSLGLGRITAGQHPFAWNELTP
jgi:hypothetical protein